MVSSLLWSACAKRALGARPSRGALRGMRPFSGRLPEAADHAESHEM
jgi:hypothetical protein